MVVYGFKQIDEMNGMLLVATESLKRHRNVGLLRALKVASV